MKKYPDRYIFPAIFSKDEEGMWDVRFPDLDNCFTSADTLEEAIDQAKYTLEDCLYFLENRAMIPLLSSWLPSCPQFAGHGARKRLKRPLRSQPILRS